ncbi:MAG: sigma-70 family RNA polymerase sigma factor [Planctomycetota bacterium]
MVQNAVEVDSVGAAAADAFGAPAGAALTDVGSSGDGELLHRYIGSAAEADRAFGALVDRHGGMVHRTCLRILGDAAAAEDASQATFLILAKRAKRVHGAVGPFLHGVAVKVSRRAFGDEQLRKIRERQAGEWRADLAKASGNGSSGAVAQIAAEGWNEFEQVLDESIHRLPRRQREAVVLHFLEGRAQAEVAQQMGLDPSTVAKQLRRALGKLQARFQRLGYRAEIASGKTAGTRSTQAALLPLLSARLARLGDETACPHYLAHHVGVLAKAGTAAHPIQVATAVQALAERTLHMIRWKQIQAAAVAVTASLVLSGTAFAAVWHEGGAEPTAHHPAVAPGLIRADPSLQGDETPAPAIPDPAPSPKENKSSGADDAGRQKVLAKLQKQVSFQFPNENLQVVLDYLRDRAGTNFVYGPSALQGKPVVQLEVSKKTIEQALKLISQTEGIAYTVEPEAVWFGSPAAVKARLAARAAQAQHPPATPIDPASKDAAADRACLQRLTDTRITFNVANATPLKVVVELILSQCKLQVAYTAAARKAKLDETKVALSVRAMSRRQALQYTIEQAGGRFLLCNGEIVIDLPAFTPQQIKLKSGVRLLQTCEPAYSEGGSLQLVAGDHPPVALTADNLPQACEPVETAAQAGELCSLLIWGTHLEDEKDFQTLLDLYKTVGLAPEFPADFPRAGDKRCFGDRETPCGSGEFDVSFTVFMLPRGMGVCAQVARVTYHVTAANQVKLTGCDIYLNGPCLNSQQLEVGSETRAERDRREAAEQREEQAVDTLIDVTFNRYTRRLPAAAAAVYPTHEVIARPTEPAAATAH